MCGINKNWFIAVIIRESLGQFFASASEGSVGITFGFSGKTGKRIDVILKLIIGQGMQIVFPTLLES